MSAPSDPHSTPAERRPPGGFLSISALAAGLVGFVMALDANTWERTFAFLCVGIAGLTIAVARRIHGGWAVSAPPDSRSTSAGTRAAAEALNLVTTTAVAACLSVAAPAAGWAGLVMVQGADGLERLFALLGLGVAGLALLAGLPHVLILRWARTHRRSPVSPWPTLAAVTATAIPFPATILTISSLAMDGAPPIQVIVLIAALAVLLVVEIILMLHLSQRDKSRVEVSSVNRHDDDAGH